MDIWIMILDKELWCLTNNNMDIMACMANSSKDVRDLEYSIFD